jgi:chromosome segregation ATPase
MKKLSIIVLFIALFAVGCEKWDHKIAAVEDRLELLEGTTIPNIEQQIVNINASIDDLKAVDEALQGLIDNLEAKAEDLQAQLDANAAADAATKAALESEIANLKALIAALQAKDVELDQKIADLQKYVDDEISATEDWANQTFSTLEQYADMQQEISALKALLEQYKSEITAAYTDAIKTAINASEASMKDWVNKTLAEGYYTKAEIDGKVSALETKIEDGDDALQKEIDALKAALEKAEGDLTVAYVEAIEKAINDNNGKINAEIAAAVKTAQDNLQAQIDAINNEIEKIKTRLDIIEADINSIKQQIDDLKGVDAELKGYIESLQNTANDLQSKIDATNDALAVLESDLEGQITASEQKVLDELKTVKTALEGQLATIKETITTLTSRLTIIEGKIVQLFNAIDECATQ